jgi:hypothetical protein
MDDASYRAVQLSLMLRPGQGAVIPGTGGLRKMRWKSSGGGKRGGLRLIYQWVPEQATCYMLFVYSKNEQGDLAASQVRELARLVAGEIR